MPMLSVLPSFKLKRSFNLLIYTFSEKILTKKEKSDIISCGVILTAFFTIWRKNMEQRVKLWKDSDVEMAYFRALHRVSDAAVVILPGGGYAVRAPYEGEAYAQLFNTFGMDAFVVDYRVSPNRFPLPLLDARRAMRLIRSNAEEYGIAKNKILIMGSSAGGHLAALTSTYLDAIEGEGVDSIDGEDFLPNGQILCYPVISSDEEIYHGGSFKNFLGERFCERDRFSPDTLVNETTPKAFIWHTADDTCVNVENSYRYASSLAKHGIPHELHVFQHGSHGLGLGEENPHVAQWTQLLRRWLSFNGLIR